MGLSARILKVVAEAGPKKKNVLLGLARSKYQKSIAGIIFARLVREGRLQRYGAKRGSTYGLPKKRRQALVAQR